AAKGTRLGDKPSLAERYLSESNHAKVERLQHFAKERGHTLLELAFSWLLAHRAVASVIAGATKPEQIEANAKAADWVLNAEELAEVDRIAGVASLSVP
ncbi:MAG: aldo/keto reductase, partial [Candidatus Korobacteraceae bacterium]